MRSLKTDIELAEVLRSSLKELTLARRELIARGYSVTVNVMENEAFINRVEYL